MKALPIAALVLTLGSGVASANRFSGGGHSVVHSGGGGHVIAHEGYHGGFHGGGFVGHGPVVRGGYYGHGGYGHGWRAPIYTGYRYHGPHYYDYRFRPGLIVEDYPVRDGYVWVRGHWDWNGVEWIWTPGYYEPVY